MLSISPSVRALSITNRCDMSGIIEIMRMLLPSNILLLFAMTEAFSPPNTRALKRLSSATSE